MRIRTNLSLLLPLLLVLGATPARAEEPKAPKPLGLNVSLELSSIYNFRGYNLFGGGDQGSQHAMMAPSVTWTIFGTGLTLGYWSAYQINGYNRRAVVETGLGHEQDFILGYSRSFLKDRLTLAAAFTVYLYPFASDRSATATAPGAGTPCPVYLEPAVSLTYNGPVEVGLGVLYYAGVQEAVSAYRYLYLNPRIAKTFVVTRSVGMRLALAYGYKLFNDRKVMTDNVHDLRFDWELPITALKSLVITPNVHVGWTNLGAVPIAEEYLIYAGVKLGYDF